MTNEDNVLSHHVLAKFPAEDTIHSISLGAGVQSTTLYLMAAHGIEAVNK